MEPFTPFYDFEGNIRVREFPDAEKFIEVNSHLSHQVADYGLHRQDLEFAQACLHSIDSIPESNVVVRESLWRSAIIHWYKCFGGSRRQYGLQRDQIYKEDIAKSVFEYFKDLRNKHFVHDENSYSQCLSGAVLNKKNAAYKIEKIIATGITGVTLDQENFSRLNLLISDAIKYVEKKFNQLCVDLTKELEAKPYEELLDMPEVKIETPRIEDIKEKRQRTSDYPYDKYDPGPIFKPRKNGDI